MTYSIVARDAATGQLGVAVQTGWFGVGAVVPWARAGVGAVATQAQTEPAYGPRCLDALVAGESAEGALDLAVDLDPMSVVRQVGVVAVNGTAAAFTGSLCIDWCGHLIGDGFTVQANMMSSPDVWPAMADAFMRSTGALERRLLTALVAGERAGGDARGPMSAAVVVVEGEPPAVPGGGVLVDVRVDRSDVPLDELDRLLGEHQAFAQLDRAVEQLVSGDAAAALLTVDAALATCPGEGNMRFARSGALGLSGAIDDAVQELRALVAERPTWEVIIRSYVAKGLLPLPEGVSIDDLLRSAS